RHLLCVCRLASPALAPQLAQRTAPALRREIAALGKQQEDAARAERRRDLLDLGLALLAVGGVKKRVGQSMTDQVDAGIDREGLLEDDAREPVKAREQE